MTFLMKRGIGKHQTRSNAPTQTRLNDIQTRLNDFQACLNVFQNAFATWPNDLTTIFDGKRSSAMLPNQFCLRPASGDCNFEKGMCTYSNVQKGDVFDWLRNSGKTPSWRTGPSTDHTTGTSKGNERNSGDPTKSYS